jgi:hypothetical protein
MDTSSESTQNIGRRLEEELDRFHGFCHHARGVRTFRIDRVVGPIVDRDTGEEQDPEVWMALAES